MRRFCTATVLLWVLLCLAVACGAEPPPAPGMVTTQVAVEKAMPAPTAETPDPTPTPTPPPAPTPSEAGGLSAAPTSEPVPLRSTFELYSEHIDDWYKIYVSLPQGYNAAPQKDYHAIYLLDGDWYFDDWSMRIEDGGVAGIAALLDNGDRIPPSIVVGIGYAGTNQRARDFHFQVEGFYAFLTDELIPHIEAEYRANPDAPRTLIGHSSGSYFTMYAFFRADENGFNPFQQFVAISGDYNRFDGYIFYEESRMSGRIGEGGTLPGALYMAVGGKDEARFVTSLEDMTKKLESRNYQDFRFKSRVYRSDDHMSVVTPAVWAGLQWVFGE